MTQKILWWLKIILPISMWLFFLFTPQKPINTIVFQKDSASLQLTHKHYYIQNSALAKTRNRFFDPKPEPITNLEKQHTIIENKLYALNIQNHWTGILTAPLEENEIKTLHKQPKSIKFDILITATSNIPSPIKGKTKTLYISSRPPSKKTNQVFLANKQPLLWAKKQTMLDFNHKIIKIFTEDEEKK